MCVGVVWHYYFQNKILVGVYLPGAYLCVCVVVYGVIIRIFFTSSSTIWWLFQKFKTSSFKVILYNVAGLFTMTRVFYQQIKNKKTSSFIWSIVISSIPPEHEYSLLFSPSASSSLFFRRLLFLFFTFFNKNKKNYKIKIIKLLSDRSEVHLHFRREL